MQVEVLCQIDPEGLALRLAGKGAVSAALDVAESFKLSCDLRRELQGRQLVKLLTTDPISGGGPAGGLRFLNSLHRPEDALPVAMAAMELLPNLQSKQLLVRTFRPSRWEFNFWPMWNLFDDSVLLLRIIHCPLLNTQNQETYECS